MCSESLPPHCCCYYHLILTFFFSFSFSFWHAINYLLILLLHVFSLYDAVLTYITYLLPCFYNLIRKDFYFYNLHKVITVSNQMWYFLFSLLLRLWDFLFNEFYLLLYFIAKNIQLEHFFYQFPFLLKKMYFLMLLGRIF